MRQYHVVHQAGDGSSTWTLTVDHPVGADDVYTILPAQSLDVTIWADGILLAKDAVDVTPANVDDFSLCTLYMRDTPQVFGDPGHIDTAALGCWVFFWAWLVSRLFPRG